MPESAVAYSKVDLYDALRKAKSAGGFQGVRFILNQAHARVRRFTSIAMAYRYCLDWNKDYHRSWRRYKNSPPFPRMGR